MTSFRIVEATAKGDKALLLWERERLPYAAIAERLSVKPGNVPGMLHRARQRRAKAAEATK